MVEISWAWLLLVPALAFAVGWFSSRIDLSQVRRAERDSPRAYYKGLNLLLNEQQDKAIDAFIEAVQSDPDTTELHFALGNLFRRRGEFERSVRVHQHLLSRGDLSRQDRDRALHALAQDYAKAGLFDRAEEAYKGLEGSMFSTDARRALLDLYERSREWTQAYEMACKLEAAGAGSFAVRMSHYLCEQAFELQQRVTTQAQVDVDAAVIARLEQARLTAPLASRPVVMLGHWHARCGRAPQALQTWSTLLTLPSAPVSLVAEDVVRVVKPAGAEPNQALLDQALSLLSQAYAAQGSLDVLQALNTLQPPSQAAPALVQHLARQPSLSAASAVLKLPLTADGPVSAAQVGPAPDQRDEVMRLLQQAVERSARPLQRFRCAACGFESQRYFWQCPGCLTWDSYPVQRIEEL